MSIKFSAIHLKFYMIILTPIFILIRFYLGPIAWFFLLANRRIVVVLCYEFVFFVCLWFLSRFYRLNLLAVNMKKLNYIIQLNLSRLLMSINSIRLYSFPSICLTQMRWAKKRLSIGTFGSISRSSSNPKEKQKKN